MNTNEHELEIVDYAFPLHFGSLKVQEESEFDVRGFQIVDALGQVFICKSVYAFQFHYELVFDQDVGMVVADSLPFVEYWKWRLRFDPQTPKIELSKEGSLINLLQKSSPEHIRNLVSSANHGPGNGFAFICVYLRQLSLLLVSRGVLT